MPSRSTPVEQIDKPFHLGEQREYEDSGYSSGCSSEASLPDVYFTKPHLVFLNRQLQNLEPQGTDHNGPWCYDANM